MVFINKKLQEFNNYLVNKKVAIIGLGVSNIPLIDYLHENRANVTVFDSRNIDDIDKKILDRLTEYAMEFSLGENYLNKLVGFDLIFRSPSCLPTVPELEAESKRGAIITTEIALLMEMCPCKIIGVTGSDGKTTTASLIYEILKEAEYNCYIGGNIGVPLFSQLSEITPEDIVILELSSFQLMGMEISPNIAVVTNISPNHLDIHSTYEEYIETKKNIFKYQGKNDLLILNYDDEIAREWANETKSKVTFVSNEVKLDDGIILDNDVIKECENKLRRHIINIKDINLKGRHNYQNVCAAIAATQGLVGIEKAIKAVKKFNGIEHRLEFVKRINGANWYNDSIASSPTRTIAGLKSFDDDIILIAGGYDKNLEYKSLAKLIVRKVTSLILLGQNSEKIYLSVREEQEKQHKNIDIYMCNEISQAVEVAYKLAKRGDTVLLSPASASFDMFKNFVERGNKFKELVEQLK